MFDSELVCLRILRWHTAPIAADMTRKVSSGGDAVMLEMREHAARSDDLAEVE